MRLFSTSDNSLIPSVNYCREKEIISTSDDSLIPSVNYCGEKVRLKFAGSVLQQKKLHIIIKKL